MTKSDYPIRVGELRPSQFMWAFGPGALVDLPQFSVVILGLDYWDRERSIPVDEARLLRAVRLNLGHQVEQLLAPPIRPDSDRPFDPFSSEARIGAPVTPFPEWLRCPICGVLARYDSGLFDLDSHPYRPDRTHYVHSNCGKARRPTAVPSRFLVACRNGHLDEFPWHWFVHRGQSDCRGQLRFYERGASLQTENLWVECTQCSARRSMAEAFGEKGRRAMPACRGRHPHLGQYAADCEEELRPVLLGASNSWFPVYLSLLAIPTKADKLTQLVEDKWELLKSIPSRDVLPHVIKPLAESGQLPGIREFDLDDVWGAIEERRSSEVDEEEGAELDLKTPEWNVFVNPDAKSDWPDFMVKSVDPPEGFSNLINSVVLVERLREVNALIGFTRIEPPEEAMEGGEPPPRASLSKGSPAWVLATEVRGEGIFLRFDSKRLMKWLGKKAVRERSELLMSGHRNWRAARRLHPLDANFPGVLMVLLHTFAHVLLRELSLECGYNAASIRERIYASVPKEGAEMAGVLLYTAASDSDGTLGGLVELGKPHNLGRLIEQALDRARFCASDPMCSEHIPEQDASLHGAACHACGFVPETSCEFGNRYLDRSLLVPTFQGGDAAFFRGSQ